MDAKQLVDLGQQLRVDAVRAAAAAGSGHPTSSMPAEHGTRHGWDTGAYARRIGAFGWHTIEIDGHDIEAIDAAYTEAPAHPPHAGPAREAAVHALTGDRAALR